MMSSDGCSARQSIYAAKISPVASPCSDAFIGLPASVRSLRVGVVADEFLVVVRNAEQHADDLHRHLRAQVLDEVERAHFRPADPLPRAEFADLGLECLDLARREHAREQLAVHVVDGWVLEDQHSRRDFQIRLDHFDDRAATRTEGLVVDQALLTSANRLSA